MGGIEKLGSVLKTLLFAAAMSYVFGDGESERELKYIVIIVTGILIIIVLL